MSPSSDDLPSFLRQSQTGELMMPDEPPRLIGRDVERLLIWATKNGASDIIVKTGDRIILKIHGNERRVSRRALTHAEVLDIIVHMFGAESPKAILSGDKDLDLSYEIRPDRVSRYRFRVNATPVTVEAGAGVDITIRTIDSRPPPLESLRVESEIIANMAPHQGMIVVSGATGSGKSTLLASIIRKLVEEPEGNRRVLTYERPIEFVYDEIEMPTSDVSQTEIGKNLKSFVDGTRNALRRAPQIILVGESRDAETIGEAVTASMTGHCLYTTVHANGFADTIRRMINVFPESEKNARAVDIVTSLRMVIAQRLVRGKDGKRVALREYVIMNDEIVDQILDGGVDNITVTCRQILKNHGRSFLKDAMDKFREGRIDERVLKEIARGAKGEEIDAAQQILRSHHRLSQLVVDAPLGLGVTKLPSLDETGPLLHAPDSLETSDILAEALQETHAPAPPASESPALPSSAPDSAPEETP